MIFVHRFCCSGGHACFPAESFFVRKIIREASESADLGPPYILQMICWRKYLCPQILISPKIAQNIFVRKSIQVGTLLKYRSYLKVTKFLVTNFSREPDSQGHLADEKTKWEFLRFRSSHSCHPHKNIRSHIVFLKLNCLLTQIVNTKHLVAKEWFQMKTKESDCKDPITTMKGSISIRAE